MTGASQSAGVHFRVWPANHWAVGFNRHLWVTVISAEDAVIFGVVRTRHA